MSLKMGPMVAPKYKQEWERTMEARYGVGNSPTSGPDCFDAWLSGQLYNAEEQLRFVRKEREKDKAEASEYKKQRNIALALCAIFFVIALVFATRPASAASAKTSVTGVRQEKYVASSVSDKYHRLSCEYADNILDENRVYYDTAADAERDGKCACSVCRP